MARVLEPHLDALAVLNEAPAHPDHVPDDASYAVWAAEAPHARLEAVRDDGAPGGWRLSGREPWCSLAGDVSHGLVTAWIGEQDRAAGSVAGLRDGASAERLRLIRAIAPGTEAPHDGRGDAAVGTLAFRDPSHVNTSR